MNQIELKQWIIENSNIFLNDHFKCFLIEISNDNSPFIINKYSSLDDLDKDIFKYENYFAIVKKHKNISVYGEYKNYSEQFVLRKNIINLIYFDQTSQLASNKMLLKLSELQLVNFLNSI